MKPFLLIAATALVAAAPAQAVSVASTTLNGNSANVVTAVAGALQADFGINNRAPIVLGLVTEAGDAGGISFDGVVDSFLGVNEGSVLRALTLSLGGGATFGTIGSIAPAFSTATGVLSAGNTRYTITFDPAENVSVILGNLDASDGDFVFDVANLAEGSAFTLTLQGAVPEPASWAMLIAGFGLTGTALRRRRQPVVAA